MTSDPERTTQAGLIRATRDEAKAACIALLDHVVIEGQWSAKRAAAACVHDLPVLRAHVEHLERLAYLCGVMDGHAANYCDTDNTDRASRPTETRP